MPRSWMLKLLTCAKNYVLDEGNSWLKGDTEAEESDKENSNRRYILNEEVSHREVALKLLNNALLH